MKRHAVVLALVVLSLAPFASRALAAPVGTAFTYQGSVDRSGGVPSDSCTFQFKLYDAASLGNQLGPTLTQALTLLQSGQFSTSLDFGVGMFDGNQRWVEIAVHCPGDPLVTVLGRQLITATPYAIYALSGPGSGGGFALPFAGAVTTITQDAFRVQNNGASGQFYALHGVSVSTSTNAGGVLGEATAASGQVIGVYGKAVSSPNGIGMIGEGNVNGAYFEAHNTTGDGTGVYGIAHTDANNAAGVKGVNYSTTGLTVGTWGYAASSPSGTGVAGIGGGTGGFFQSNDAASPGSDFAGVYAIANVHPGVKGISTTADGVYGSGGNAGLYGRGTNYGVVGTSTDGFGVYGIYGLTFAGTNGTNAGVYGNSASTNNNSAGVRGEGSQAYGVEGISSSGAGVYGHSSTSIGVSGASPSYFGVLGVSGSQAGVKGISGSASGVYGQSSSATGYGVFGTNSAGDGIWGQSSAGARSGVVGVSSSASGIGGFFNNSAGGVALYANGLAQVKTLQILGADLAESFPVEGGAAEPGTVLAIAGGSEGALRVCDEAYCRRVAGVVSGAHDLPAGVVLKGAAFDSPGHATVAMSGRVWVRCDATGAPIRVGDLLTSAALHGHAMRADDPARATGAILGKAMTSLEAGTGLVLVLVSLQ